MQKKMSQNFYDSNTLKLFGVAFFFYRLEFVEKEFHFCHCEKKTFFLHTPSIGITADGQKGNKKDSEIKECCTTPSCKTGRLLRDFVLLFLFHAICILSVERPFIFCWSDTDNTIFDASSIIEMLDGIIFFFFISISLVNGRANKTDVIEQ